MPLVAVYCGSKGSWNYNCLKKLAASCRWSKHRLELSPMTGGEWKQKEIKWY